MLNRPPIYLSKGLLSELTLPLKEAFKYYFDDCYYQKSSGNIGDLEWSYDSIFIENLHHFYCDVCYVIQVKSDLFVTVGLTHGFKPARKQAHRIAVSQYCSEDDKTLPPISYDAMYLFNQ